LPPPADAGLPDVPVEGPCALELRELGGPPFDLPPSADAGLPDVSIEGLFALELRELGLPPLDFPPPADSGLPDVPVESPCALELGLPPFDFPPSEEADLPEVSTGGPFVSTTGAIMDVEGVGKLAISVGSFPPFDFSRLITELVSKSTASVIELREPPLDLPPRAPDDGP